MSDKDMDKVPGAGRRVPDSGEKDSGEKASGSGAGEKGLDAEAREKARQTAREEQAKADSEREQKQKAELELRAKAKAADEEKKAAEEEKKRRDAKSFMGRLRRVKPTRWIRFAIVSIIFFLWVILMGNPWLAFLWLILLDVYITAYVPWGWWKKKKGLTRSVMAWVDAIVYALILIYFIFAFVGQQYEIPSSSLEKSLLVGDRLWVDKTVYGSRVRKLRFISAGTTYDAAARHEELYRVTAVGIPSYAWTPQRRAR